MEWSKWAMHGCMRELAWPIPVLLWLGGCGVDARAGAQEAAAPAASELFPSVAAVLGPLLLGPMRESVERSDTYR